MTAAINHERDGAQLATECLDAILGSTCQASACNHVLDLLNKVSGCSEIAKAKRRGAAAALVNVLERGIEASRTDKEAQ